MKVTSEIAIHEGVSGTNLSINSHEKNANLVILLLGNTKITVKATDLVRAVENATNIKEAA